ncbi:MAG: hypothetical protein ACP5LF_03255 [Nitrososphaeria archaeon]
MRHRVYFHPACHTSYTLLKSFNGIELYADLVDVSKDPTLVITKRVLTVPLIETSGKFVYGGPIDIDLAIRYLKGEKFSLDVKDPFESLGIAVVDSSAASSIVLSSGSLKPLLYFDDFIKAATGLNFDPDEDRKFRDLLEQIEKRESEFIEKWERKMVATLAYNIIRERLYLGLKPEASYEDVLLWFEAKTSLGRVGVPYFDRVEHLKKVSENISAYISERKDKINERLENEISEIRSFFLK